MGKVYRDLVRAHSQAKGSARNILNVLADYADDDGLAWPGRAALANDTGMSGRNVIRCLQTLCEQRRISLVEHGRGGRGNMPIYKIWMPEIGQPAPLQDVEIPSERVSSCHPLGRDEELEKGDNLSQRVTNEHVKGDNLSRKGDKCAPIPSYVRSEPQEPHIEPNGETPPRRVLRSRNRERADADAIEFKSPHVENCHFDLGTGYIATGIGATAVEVYYERFDVAQKGARLNAVKEDDLVRHCGDLGKLREVITAYSRTTYQPGNVQLILDWYDGGIPDQYRGKQGNGANHANHGTNNSGDYQRPAAATFTQAEQREYAAKQRAQSPF